LIGIEGSILKTYVLFLCSKNETDKNE